MSPTLPFSSLHVGAVALAAVACATALFLYGERNGRSRWVELTRKVTTGSGPYRSTSLAASHLRAAPRLVRATSFTGLAFGHLFVPILTVALVVFPFDGIAVPLLPGIAVAVANWWCAWLLLRRSSLAQPFGRAAAVSSLVANIGLLALCPIHLLLIENQRLEGIVDACSSSVTGLELVFALAAVVQASLILATLRFHKEALDPRPST